MGARARSLNLSHYHQGFAVQFCAAAPCNSPCACRSAAVGNALRSRRKDPYYFDIRDKETGNERPCRTVATAGTSSAAREIRSLTLRTVRTVWLHRRDSRSPAPATAECVLSAPEDGRQELRQGPFDHSKLLVVDSIWAFVGSSNLDPRSLRLNFEIDLEVLDAGFAARIERRIEAEIGSAVEVTLESLRARPFAGRLIDRILWLGSPNL